MKKLLALLLLSGIALTNSFALEEESMALPVQFDAGGFVSIVLPGEDYNKGGGFWELINSMRAGVSAAARYEIIDMLSAGLELGVAIFPTPEGYTTPFFDLPMNAIVRYGIDGTFFEARVGYVLSNQEISNGFNVGGRASLNNYYVDFGYVIGTYNSQKFGLGFQVNNLLEKL